MERLHPAFQLNNIAIALCADDNFVPYSAVAIRSVQEHASVEDNYDFVLLHSGISRENQELLAQLTVDVSNASLRLVDVAEPLESYQFFTQTAEGEGRLTREAYYRLLIPELMAGYDRVLYMDGDMLALTDVAPLYRTPLEGELVAAVRDLAGLMRYYSPLKDRKRYWENELKLAQPENYFNSGLLLMNIPALRAAYTTQYLLDFAVSRQWLQHDQDVLNVLCQGRVKLVDAAWNSIQPEPKRFLPPERMAEFEASVAQPKIAHFAGSGDKKPWITLDAPHSAAFWRCAAQTPFFMELLSRRVALDRPAQSARSVVEAEFRQGKLGAWYIVKFAKAWLAHKLGR